ncbi:hypothetical protein [Brevundimonas subvibrioides]|uniref:hypothetical protein n=1 Tax=Brevundimonas subvibrioides TaxID=74313 RepID=UPI0022B4191C|nr:hypothetical protein [Brevundimonas subvibrioides]
MAGPVHYELYIRKTVPSPWALIQATENRHQAIETAEQILRDKEAVAVRVTKETMDPDTKEFQSVAVLTRGEPELPTKKVVDAPSQPNCMAPAHLYTPRARELLGRVLEDWLMRHGVTPFELLHRPDLVERLEASGVEVQHAIQKVAIPESQATGQPAHDLIRHYQHLTEQAMAQVVTAGRKGTFVDLTDRSLADVAHRLAGTPDRAFVMGGVISGALVGARGARARLDRLMNLAESAPMDGAPRALVMSAIEQILVELLGARSNLAEILGPALDQGGSLAAVVRMVAPREIEALIAHDPRMALLVPAVDGAAVRLGQRLDAGEYPTLAASLARMVLRELRGPRRLRPSDATGEIDILRTLAMSLTATAGRLLMLEDVQTAFIERSRSLVTADFVQAYVASCDTVLCEAEQLTRLCENVTGSTNKRAAARWLVACVTSLRFETEMRGPGPTPARKLQVLAQLQRSVQSAALIQGDAEQIAGAIGALGGVIEAEAKLTALLARAPAPIHQKLAALLRLAAGETAPLGPATERAKAEAIRMFRAPDARAALSAAPEALAPLKTLMQAAGLAA